MTGLPEETKSGVAIEQSVMAGHSRPKDGVASLAYARRSIMEALCLPKRDRRDKPGDDGVDGPRRHHRARLVMSIDQRREPSMGEISMIGLDIAKHVFHVHGVDASGAPVLRRQLRRGKIEEFFAKLPPTLVGLEACGSAHHWARVIGRYGHQVRLMPPGYVKPYVKRNKNDERDAEAICEAVGRPNMRFVAVKSVEQQATLSVYTTRALLV